MMTVDSISYKPLYGFKTDTWPLKQNVIDAIVKFSDLNGLVPVTMNATVWTMDAYPSSFESCIQLSFYDKQVQHPSCIGDYIYPVIYRRIDEFDAYDQYASSIEDYFKICSSSAGAFCWQAIDGYSFKKHYKVFNVISYAENALIDLDLSI